MVSLSPAPPATRLAFDQFVLDCGTRRVFRGPSEIRLTRRLFELIYLLAANAPRPVARTVLKQRLWPNGYATPQALHQTMSDLRKAIGDVDRQTRLVRTVRGHGYALHAAVESRALHQEQIPFWRGVAAASTPAAIPDPLTRFGFDDYVVDADAGRVCCGLSSVEIRPQALELLKALAWHGPQALSKSDLRRYLWPDVYVSDGALPRLIYEVRTVLYKASGRRRVLRTIPTFGYALDARRFELPSVN